MKKFISVILSFSILSFTVIGCQKGTSPIKPQVVPNQSGGNDTTGDTTGTTGEQNNTNGTLNQPNTNPGDGNVQNTNPPNSNNNPKPPTNNNIPEGTNPSGSPNTPNSGNPGVTTGDVVNDILTNTNAERTKQGLQPLKLNAGVSKLAAMKARDMYDKNYFSHTSPTYGDPGQMLTNNGFKYATMGENIYTSTGMTPNGAYTVTQWMNSPGHRANILNSAFKEIGIGIYYSNGRYYATQMFYTPQ
ncbi:CAP domain-containing protein [Clostridium paridis]|uniref:Serine protease n=1 Tax=Clostridium paridis TaxID=2803863 RepID=A0A937K4B2_9CLOT|nr:CAP domain-containing protein [Clostridium paridis]MBL4932472.1 serine protease [Clostridium paridis]